LRKRKRRYKKEEGRGREGREEGKGAPLVNVNNPDSKFPEKTLTAISASRGAECIPMILTRKHQRSLVCSF